MQKIDSTPRVFFLYLVLTLTLVEVIYPASFAYATDKRQTITGQTDLVGSLLEKERFSSKGSEAERFIQEMVKEAKLRRKIELKVDTPSEIRSKALLASSQKPETPQEVPKPSEKLVPSSYGEKKAISEGEALYKVAVSDNVVTLKETIRIALANNLQANAAKKKIDVARAKLTEARRALFPTVQGVMEKNGGKVGDATNISGRVFQGRNSKINITQPLFHGGELLFTVRQAEENLKLSTEEYKKVRNEAIHQVRTAYFGAVKQEYNLQYQFSLLNEIGALHKMMREAYTAKLVSEIDFLNVDSQYHQVGFQVEAARNDLLSANLLLRQNLSLVPEAYLPINLRLSYMKLDPDFRELLQIALNNNPELRMKEYALQSSIYGVKIYGAKKLPKVDLRGSFGTMGESFHDDTAFTQDKDGIDQEKEWFLGIQASMPLGPNSVEYASGKHKYGPTVLSLTGSEDWNHKVTFNLMDKFSDITDEKSAESAYAQALSDLQTANNNLISQLRDSYYNLKKSILQMDSAIAKIKYQEKQTAAARYLMGLQETPASSLLESLIELTSHKFSLIQASVDYYLAISNLNLSMGDPYYFETES